MIDPKSINQPFWGISIEETLKILETKAYGLSSEEVDSRLKVFGANEIKDRKSFSRLRLFLDQFKSPLIFILIIAGTVTTFLEDWIDVGVIFAAVFVNVVLGFYQENKAGNILELLKSYVKTRTRVRRSGREEIIDASGLVPGDIIRITQGDKIPADARIIFANSFQVDESVLTGESVPVEKKSDTIEISLPVSDRTSMVFSGTLAVSGFADVVLTATGRHSEFGKIAELLAEPKDSKTPLQVAISRFSFWTGMIFLILTIALFGSGIYLSYDPLDMFLIAVAVAVSAVPEGLPIALTVILAVGVEQLARKKGIVKRLLAAETLGSTSLILTDKTGTLTEAKMEMTAVIPYGDFSDEAINSVLHKALTTADVVIENPHDKSGNWNMYGNFMEVALVAGAAKKGILLTDIVRDNPTIDKLNFSSDRKFAAGVHHDNGDLELVLLGAPDILVKYTNLSEEKRAEILRGIDERAFSGERVLGIVSAIIAEGYGTLASYELKNLNFDGMLTFRDPLRPGVADSVRRIKDAGVKTIIVTGDHRGTAEAVAREIGLLDGVGAVLTGEDLHTLSKDELYARADEVSVYARVTPEQKVMIAKMYEEKGEIVAMTGDGVNDAPVVEAADIGVALGTGADVTKSAADLVILDNNYEIIVTAIEQGRRILDNIRKIIVYLLSNSLDELFLIGGAIFTGMPIPITTTQILFVNFFSDSFPAIAFAFDKGVDGLGHQPRKLSKNIFDSQMKFLLLLIGISTSALLFLMYYFLLRAGFPAEIVKTFIFASFSTYTLLVSFSLRSLDKSIFTYNPFANLYLALGSSAGILFALAGVYMPFMQKILGTVSLPLSWAVAVGAVGVFNIMAVEFGKWLYKRIYKH